MRTRYFLLTILAVLLVAQYSTAQTRRIYYKQKIPNKYRVTEVYKVQKADSVIYEQGSVLSKTIEKTDSKGIKYAYTTSDTLKKGEDSTVYIAKEKFKERRIPGSANIYFNKDNDRDKLYVDYWLLSYPKLFKAGDVLEISNYGISKKITLKNDSTFKVSYISKQTLTHAQNAQKTITALQKKLDEARSLLNDGNSQTPYDPKRISDAGIQKTGVDVTKEVIKTQIKLLEDQLDMEFKNSTHSLWVNDVTKTIKSNGELYAEKYPETAYINLDNRQYVKLKFRAVELGLLTIPFKVRNDFTRNNVDIQGGVSTDLNAGTYLGFTCGKMTYKYSKSGDNTPLGRALSGGLFMSFGTAEVDSSLSLSAEIPQLIKRTVLTVSPGVGINYNFYDFNIGLFYGWDFALGEVGKKWDYNRRPWFGFGVGYNLTLLGNLLKNN